MLLGLLLAALATGDEPKPLTKLEELAKFHQPVIGMSAQERLAGYALRLEMERNSPFNNIGFRSVGPEIQGGRLVDIAVPEGLPATMFIAYATGGLWRTDNMGTTWIPLFERESSFGIGDIAIFGKKAEVIWVGTGEANSSRTSYAGTGVFKSTDSGKTWQNVGLTDTHHIGRVLTHPTNPNIVYVAAIGHLYSWNDERGVFKTTDGGKTWRKVLYTNDRTGAIDILMDPRDPETIYSAMWERDRRAWNFLESGEGSGVYKTHDGGRTWTKLTGGLPEGQYVGRIGLALCKSRPDTLYVVIDNQQPRPEAGMDDERAPSGELTVRRLQMMNEEQLLQVEKRSLERFLRSHFPPDLTADRVIEMLKVGELTVRDLLSHLRSADYEMFNAPIIGPQVYRSNDAGKTWTLATNVRLDNIFYTYGYYFGQISVAPDNPEKVFLLGVPILMSEDGAKTFKNVGGRGVHVDHHTIWIDPRWPDKVALGNDGGLNLSWDGGKTWQKINNMPVGQFTTIAIDNARPYRIYGGLQDNGTMRGPSNYVAGRNNPWDWTTIGGGDGSCVQVDTRDNETVITASQFGAAFRRGADGKSWPVRPLAKFGEQPLRYNWVTPFLLSPHHQDILYYGANKLFRSMNQGQTWTLLSPDLSSNPPQGDVPFGTCTTISESPKRFGLLYVGTDEGRLWRSVDGGFTWTDLSVGLAPERWVTRVVASMHDEKVVYVSQTGYRQDDFAAYLWKSDDYGNTWRSISGGLPAEPINVVREDPTRKGMLYVGTDMGVFVSFDDGESWEVLAGGLPHTPVHDLVIHPREGDIVLGTHGRSVWVASVKLLQTLTDEIRAKPVHLYPIEPITASRYWGYENRPRWDPTPPPEPSMNIAIWLNSPSVVTIVLKDKDGNPVKTMTYRSANGKESAADRGFNFIPFSLLLEPGKEIPIEGRLWEPKTLQDVLSDPFADLRPKFLKPGEYTVEVSAGGATETTTFILRPPD